MKEKGRLPPEASSRTGENEDDGATRAVAGAGGRNEELGAASSGAPSIPCLLYVCGLPADDDFSDRDVRRLLGTCGNVLDYRRARNPLSDELLSFCSCTFGDVGGATRCVQVLGGRRIGKAVLSIETAVGARSHAGEGESVAPSAPHCEDAHDSKPHARQHPTSACGQSSCKRDRREFG